MIAVFARLEAQPGRRDDVIEALAPVLAAAESEEGTLVYAMHVSEREPDGVRFYELYTDDDAMRAHGSSDAMRDAGAALASLLTGPPEIVRATPAAAKGLPPG